MEALLSSILQYVLVFICGYLLTKGVIATWYDFQDRRIIRLRDKRLEYEEKNKLIDEMNKYQEKTSYNDFYENLEELPKEERKNKNGK